MNIFLQKIFRLLSFFKTRVFAVAVLSFAVAAMIYTISSRTNAVYIRDGDQTVLKFTLKQDVNEILEQNGITTMACDAVDFSGFSGKLGEIHITRAFPVSITADGKTFTVMITPRSVGALLEEENITLGPEDRVNLPLSHTMEKDDRLVIRRVTYTTRTEQEEIPFEVHAKKTSLLREGKQRITQEGKNGLKQYTYSQRTVDGVLEEETLISEKILTEPVSKELLLGARVPVSDLDFGFSLDENLKPVNYKQVITHARATGYSARPGAGTASGRPARVGHVAVNPNVIPYGTKLYIAAPDNSFIYGYAIAADTGYAAMDGRIDVDLFYDTYLESCLNSVRWVNIYILE